MEYCEDTCTRLDCRERGCLGGFTNDKNLTVTTQEVDTRYGGPYDRGGADKWYGRPFNPHYYVFHNYGSVRIDGLAGKELAEYTKGYEEGMTK